jgi:hypothetical protein
MEMGRRSGRAKISMYLRAPQIWWAYLALRSNPSIGRLIESCDRLIVFDDPARVPANAVDANGPVQYLMVFWDGLTDEAPCEAASSALRTGDLRFFVVGDYSAVAKSQLDVQGLYADGPFDFTTNTAHFDPRTIALLLAVRLKALLIPLKNILQRSSNTSREIRLLLGKKQVVFCGSVGITARLISMFCRRYSVDPALFEGHQFFSHDPEASLEMYRAYLHDAALMLADLNDRQKINAHFFISCMQLLGRGYFIERIRDAGLPLYVNGFANGSFVDVYSTPFYSQHVFLDFGSVVGIGNYPRLADLRYFEKTTVEITLSKELDPLLAAARIGSLETLFEQEWNLKAPGLLKRMK